MTIAIVLVILHGLLWTAGSWATVRNFTGDTPLYLGLLLVSSIASVVAGVALLYWKRWGFYVYAASVVAEAVLTLLFTGSAWVMIGGLLPAFVVAYILYPKIRSFA